MSLNFFTDKVADVAHLKDENGNWNHVCESLSFNTMYLGVPKITEANVDVFWQRYLAWNFVNNGTFDVFLTHEEVRKSVGFATNATPYTDAVFAKRLSNIVMDRAKAVMGNQRFDKSHEND